MFIGFIEPSSSLLLLFDGALHVPHGPLRCSRVTLSGSPLVAQESTHLLPITSLGAIGGRLEPGLDTALFGGYKKLAHCMHSGLWSLCFTYVEMAGCGDE